MIKLDHSNDRSSKSKDTLNHVKSHMANFLIEQSLKMHKRQKVFQKLFTKLFCQSLAKKLKLKGNSVRLKAFVCQLFNLQVFGNSLEGTFGNCRSLETTDLPKISERSAERQIRTN